MSVQLERIESSRTLTVDAERSVSVATTRLIRFHMHDPADNIRREPDNYWLDMCLTPRPRNARACYVEHWAPHRFERIGQVFLLPPRETFRVLSDGGPTQSSVVCHLRPEALRSFFDGDLSWTDVRLEAGLDIVDKNVRWLLLRLAEELKHPGFGGATLMELIVAQISIELARYCSAIQERPANGTLAAWRLRALDERLREVESAPSLMELAALCNMSVRQLTRAFRASRGCSIGDYVAECRIDNAKRLLASEQSVKAVAYALGFNSPSSFSFAFRRATGMTPRAYQLDARSGAH